MKRQSGCYRPVEQLVAVQMTLVCPPNIFHWRWVQSASLCYLQIHRCGTTDAVHSFPSLISQLPHSQSGTCHPGPPSPAAVQSGQELGLSCPTYSSSRTLRWEGGVRFLAPQLLCLAARGGWEGKPKLLPEMGSCRLRRNWSEHPGL